MSCCIANKLIRRLGGFHQRSAKDLFRALHAAIGSNGGVAVLLQGGRIERALRPGR